MSASSVEVAGLRAAKGALEAEVATVNTRCEDLRSALATAGLRREALERDVATLRAAAAQSREDAGVAGSQVADLRAQVDALRMERDSAEAKTAAVTQVCRHVCVRHWG